MKRKEVDHSVDDAVIRQWVAYRLLVDGEIGFVPFFSRAKDLFWNNCRYLISYILNSCERQRYLTEKFALKSILSVSLLK